MVPLVNCAEIKQEDEAAVKALWQMCFDDTEAFVDWYFRCYYHWEYTLGIKENDVLMASAQVIPYRLYVRSRQLPAGYVVGVDTAPAGRHKGYAKSLLYGSLSKMRQEQVPLALLMPFEGQFYYRYGWSFCYFQQWYRLAPAELSCLAEPWGEIREIHPREHLQQLEEIYQQQMTLYHGYACREKKNWEAMIADSELEQGHWLLLEHQGKGQGYMLCLEQEHQLVVQEIACCDGRAYRALLYYLSQYGAEQLELHTGVEDELAFRLAKGKENVLHYPFLMARIVDVVDCLSRLPYPVDCPPCIFAVRDDFAPWNHGSYRLTVTDGRAELCSGIQAAPQLTVTIEGLTQLVLGVKTARQLYWQGELATDNEQLLDSWTLLWPQEKNYLNAYY